jgi:hypothetical protein
MLRINYYYYYSCDFIKQATMQSSYPTSGAIIDGIPDVSKPQTFLYKRCCLESFVQWYYKHSLERQGRSKENPDNRSVKHFYTIATTRDAATITLSFPIGSQERREGHYHSQLYSEVQASFGAAKAYPFENKGYENLATDPDFVESMQYAGGAVAFNAKTCERGYLASKNRANRSTQDAQLKSYGNREEHCISLELFDAI